MAELKIDLRGMTLAEICRAYPEQVAAAIEPHIKESAPSASTNYRSDEIAFLEYVYGELQSVNYQHIGNLNQKINDRIAQLRALR